MDYRLPAYTFDKTCCGLIDAHEFAGDTSALDVLWSSTQAVLPHLPEKALSRAEQRARFHKDISYTFDETYTLPENFFLAYQRSGDPRYKDLAVRFIEKEYFDPLAEGTNDLPGEHAYSHVNALSSAMQAYLVLGDEKYLRAATNGFRMVQEQSYVTGGWGPDEAFVQPGSDGLWQSLGLTHSSFETPCGVYGHFKITRYLLRVTGDSRYGDSMERILYNTIAGAWPILPDGTSFYYSDYNNAAKKVHYKDKWPCCSGTFPQLTADYGISSYLREQRRDLRQPVSAVHALLAAKRYAGHAHANHEVSASEHHAAGIQARATRDVHRQHPHPRMGGTEDHRRRQRQPHPRRR